MDTHDTEISSILEEFTELCRLTGNFVSDTVFNLSNKVLSDTKIRILEKGFDFAPIQNKIDEPKLRRDFKEVFGRMRLK